MNIALNSGLEGPTLVDGRRLLGAIAVALAAGAGIGSVTFFALRSVADSNVVGQVITLQVYAFLVGSIAFAFRPVRTPPLAFHYTGANDLGIAFLTWLGVMAFALLVYRVIAPLAEIRSRL